MTRMLAPIGGRLFFLRVRLAEPEMPSVCYRDSISVICSALDPPLRREPGRCRIKTGHMLIRVVLALWGEGREVIRISVGFRPIPIVQQTSMCVCVCMCVSVWKAKRLRGTRIHCCINSLVSGLLRWWCLTFSKWDQGLRELFCVINEGFFSSAKGGPKRKAKRKGASARRQCVDKAPTKRKQELNWNS